MVDTLPDGRGRWATAAWLAILALAVVAAALTLATAGLDIPDSWGFRGGILLYAVVFGSVGVVIARRRPGHRIGSLFLAIAGLSAVQGFATAYVETGVYAFAGHLPAIPAVAWLLTWLWVPSIGMATIGLPLLFPDGHLLSRAWRPVTVVATVGLAAQAIAFAFEPGPIPQAVYLDNPLGLAGVDPAAPVFLIVFLVWPMTACLAVISQLRRWHGARAEARQQLKWFALAALMTLVAAVVYSISAAVAGGAGGGTLSRASEVVLVVCILTIPVAAGIAVLRYRLYEIDRIISRTIGWAVVTGVLVAVFAVVVVALQSILAGVTHGHTLAVAASTLAAFALFQPVRRRVQRAVDRRFDRARYDAQRTVDDFARRLSAETDMEKVTGDLSGTAGSTVAPASLAIWLRPRRVGR